MEHRLEFPVEKMCAVLGVSRSGYYRWQRQQAEEAQRANHLDGLIQASFASSRGTYGSPRIHHDLARQGVRVSRATIARRMRRQGLRSRPRKRWTPTTTESDHALPVADNVLDRNFAADRPGTKWVSDITYFAVDQRWYYLTMVLDLADRGIVSWVISDDLSAESTTVAALRRAVSSRKPGDDLVFHSDRGVQYSCGSFREELAAIGATQSMSRKGNCWDNAVAESFFKTLKAECIDRHEFHNPHQAWSVIFDYIEGWYNTNRIHTTLRGLTVRQAYEQKMQSLISQT